MMEHFFNHIFGKVLIMVVLAVCGIVIVVVRKIITTINKKSAQSTIDALQKSQSFANDLIASLDIPYARKENFPILYFDKLKSHLTQIKLAGNFSILHVANLHTNEILVITELNYSDFDVSYLGKSTDVTKKAYHQFVLRHDHSNNILIVLSNIYHDTNSKFQKEEFIDAIFKGTVI
jgi:hypothetical protein